MHIVRKDISETKVQLSVTAAEAYLAPFKLKTLEKVASQVKIPGFREGKAPLNLVEKHADPQIVQREFLDAAVNSLYIAAVNDEKLRPIDNPTIQLKKFVPFTSLEFEAEINVLGPVKLPDYKKIKKQPKPVSVSAKQVEEVISNLQTRMAETKEVQRPARDSDKVWIDFKGTDEKGNPVKGADGTNYPLLLGSDTFIPGFEKNLVGLKPKEEKTFTLTFPKDYGVSALANSKVTFAVTIKKVEEVKLPAVNDSLASKAGPFKTVAELKTDIKKQLKTEQEQRARQELEGEIVKEISQKATLTIPDVLIDEQIDRLKTELRQNLTYRGITFNEYLEREGKTEQAYTAEVLRPEAEQRVRAGLVLSEIAEVENISVTPEELEIRLQLLKGQYQDAGMQAELDKPEGRRDIAARLLTEKTIQTIVKYATQ